jgi:cyclopropane fatty-acyl-phospholipid synthase-like methyltransferase
MKRVAPAADRNKLAIAEVLAEVLPATGVVLEIASGSGQHSAFFARRFGALTWQPSDLDTEALASIEAYRTEAGLTNLRPPVRLDAASAEWPLARVDAVVCINMIHIAPWPACVGLLRGAGRVLPDRGPLVLYGPFSIDGDFTAPSNIAFDQRLRGDNPQWGVRELRDVERAAADAGLDLDRLVPRPANNHVVVFRRPAARP